MPRRVIEWLRSIEPDARGLRRRPPQRNRYALQSLLPFLSAVLLPAGLAYAQPSGGPYGPIDQRYEIPKAGTVYYVAPDGKSDATGTDLEKPTTIEAAMDRVVTGDAIVLRGGVYRTGGLVLNQGITIQPYGDEHPILKGTEVATQWEALPNNVWRTPLEASLPRRAVALVESRPRRNEDAAATASTTTWSSSTASF